MNLRITVVTICFNNPEDVKNTCASVDAQMLKPYEHIIVNGSTTGDIADWHTSVAQPAYRTFVHERDKGISDAFNKGILQAKGDIIVLLNSADEFENANVLGIVTEQFAKDPDLKWLHGKYKFNRGGIWVELGKSYDKALLYRGMRAICHQTMFVKKELYDKYGLYDVELKLAMDFDFLVRIRDEKFIFLQEVMVRFAPGGTSAIHVRKGLNENTLIIDRHLGYSIKHRIWRTRILILSTLLSSELGKILYKLKVKMKLENM